MVFAQPDRKIEGFPQNQQTQSNINQAIAVHPQLPWSNIGHFLQFSS
jgi:hypothetical protein